MGSINTLESFGCDQCGPLHACFEVALDGRGKVCVASRSGQTFRGDFIASLLRLWGSYKYTFWVKMGTEAGCSYMAKQHDSILPPRDET